MYPFSQSSAAEHRCDTAGPVTYRNNNAVVHCSTCGRAILFTLFFLITITGASFADISSLPEIYGSPRPWITVHSRARSGRGGWSQLDETTIFAKPFSGNFDTLDPPLLIQEEFEYGKISAALIALSCVCWYFSSFYEIRGIGDYEVYQNCLEVVDDDGSTRLEFVRRLLFQQQTSRAAGMLDRVFDGTRDITEADLTEDELADVVTELEQLCRVYETKRHQVHQKPALRHKEGFRAFLERAAAGTGLESHTYRFYTDVVPQLATMHHMDSDELYVHLVRLSNGYCVRHELDHVAQFTFERLMMQYCAEEHINIERPFHFVSSS